MVTVTGVTYHKQQSHVKNRPYMRKLGPVRLGDVIKVVMAELEERRKREIAIYSA